MECTYAIGNFVPLFVVFKGSEFCEGLSDRANCFVTKFGWINEEAYTTFLTNLEYLDRTSSCSS
jgi:hypothetical protein